MTGCPLCTLPLSRIRYANDLAFGVLDGFPVSPGHTLILPRRHVTSFFATTLEERTALLALLDEAKARLDRELRPAGYNIGINDGVAAGQTVRHLHIHLIPRYLGDCPDPRGGIRWIFPEKAEYWNDRSAPF